MGTPAVVLIVDNDGGFVSSLRRILERSRLSRDYQIQEIIPSETEVVTEVVRRFQEILSAQGQPAVVFLDIVFAFNKPEDRTGLEIARQIRPLAECPILAVTGYTTVHSLLVDVSLDPNIDGILPKELLVTTHLDELAFADYLRRANEALARQSPASRVPYDRTLAPILVDPDLLEVHPAGDAATEYQVQHLGLDILRSLLYGTFGAGSCTLRAFSPGFSGALLFRVEFESRDANSPPLHARNWIVKVLREQEGRVELQRSIALRQRGVGKQWYPQLLSDEPGVSAGYLAFAMEELTGAKPLRALLPGLTKSTCLALTDELLAFFGEYYGSPLRKSLTLWTECYQISPIRRAKIFRWLDSHESLLKRRCPGPEVQRVRLFLQTEGRSEQAVVGIAGNYDTAYVHGDLHLGNVLAATNPALAVRIIDFAKSDQDHLARDIVKLEIDALIGCLGANTGAEHEWDDFEKWRTAATQIVSAGLRPDDESIDAGFALDTTVGFALLLRKASGKLLERVTWPEYLCGLLHYSLQYLSYDDMPVPKKALALLLGSSILDSLSQQPVT